MHQLSQHAGFGAIAGRSAIDAAGSKIDAVLAGAAITAADWPEPTPLPDELPKVMQFDPALLPEAIRGWIMDISHRMQCPPDFSAVAAVAALSSLIGARAVVKPKARDGWVVVVNIWALAIGRPGEMKSPAISELLKPLPRPQADERMGWETAMQKWEIDDKLAELATADQARIHRERCDRRSLSGGACRQSLGHAGISG